ncbi:MAG: hypothetical protein RR400_03190 [Clostridia bacterium]
MDNEIKIFENDIIDMLKKKKIYRTSIDAVKSLFKYFKENDFYDFLNKKHIRQAVSKFS